MPARGEGTERCPPPSPPPQQAPHCFAQEELAHARRTASQYKDSTSEHLATVDDLRRRATQEQESLLARVKQETQRARSLRQRLAARENESEQATAQLRAARAELASTRSDAEGMVKVIASLERQVGAWPLCREGLACCPITHSNGALG